VCAKYAGNLSAPAFLLRTYSYQTRDHDTPNFSILEAARATSAAPTFFKSITIDGVSYANGGFEFNNPSLVLITEAKTFFPRRPIACLVSIGSGSWDIPLSLSFIKRHLPCIRDQLMETVYSESTNAIVDQLLQGMDTAYIRLNSPLGHLPWDWRNASRIEKLTSAYLLNREKMDEAARLFPISVDTSSLPL
jgi:hypothetical protein